jgi:hypothetical protein
MEIFILAARGAEGARVALDTKMYIFWNRMLEVNEKHGREYLP